MVQDVNGDGQLEIVVTAGLCGAHTCHTIVHVGQWNGTEWRDLGEARTSNVDQILWTDEDGDGVEELMLHGGMSGSLGAGLHRSSTFVYAYRDGKYRLVEQRKDPSTHVYLTMLDAHEALSQGQLDRALELAERNLSKPVERVEKTTWDGDYEQVNDWVYVRIMSYTAIEAMLIHGLRSEPDEMLSLLARIERDYDRGGNPYVQAARCLWETYRASGNIESACQVMQWTVQRSGSVEGALWQHPGYATEILPLDQLCPLGD